MGILEEEKNAHSFEEQDFESGVAAACCCCTTSSSCGAVEVSDECEN